MNAIKIFDNLIAIYSGVIVTNENNYDAITIKS